MRNVCYEFHKPCLTLDGVDLPIPIARIDWDPRQRSPIPATFEIETTTTIAKEFQSLARHMGSVDALIRGRCNPRVATELEFRFKWLCRTVVRMEPSNGSTAWLSGPVRGNFYGGWLPEVEVHRPSSEWVINPVNPWGRWD